MSSRPTGSGVRLSALHLLHRAGQRADELFAANIGKSDLTPRQFAVLRYLADHEDVSQMVLVDATGIDRSTLADIVRRLLGKGLIQRKRTREDARMYAVRLSAAGQSVLNQSEPAAVKTDERLLAPLTQTERAQLAIALVKIISVRDPRSNATSRVVTAIQRGRKSAARR